MKTYRESRGWPDPYGSWSYAVLWRSEVGDFRLTPVGEKVRSDEGLPRWDGDVRAVVEAQPGSFSNEAVRQSAQESEYRPDGQWVLAVLSHNPSELPTDRFTACGPVRSGDPEPLVQRLHSERRQDPLRAASSSLGRGWIPEERSADGTVLPQRSALERLAGPDSDSSWRYAAVYTDGNEILRYAPIGESVRAQEALPRWVGDVHPVVHTPRGMAAGDTPTQQAWESERLPSGAWVLGVVSEHHPMDALRTTFAVCGSPRPDDPRAAVADLHRQIEQGKLQPSRGLARVERSSGRDRATDRRDGGHSSPRHPRHDSR